MVKNLNRIKAVLADKQKTNKWLAEQLDKDPATVSKWCTNSFNPPSKLSCRLQNYSKYRQMIYCDWKKWQGLKSI